MIEQRFFEILEELSFAVEYDDLSSTGRLGECIPANKLIRLHHDLSHRELPYVLGHETWHAINEDEPTMFGYFDERMERQADEWSAMHCIDLAHFCELESQFSGHIPTIAFHLNVPKEAVDVYVRLLSRIGDELFLGARMGTGQWLRKIAVA
ncbi:ImmA/IrrE family metallo-endopeptidase [Leucobacter japonicus]|uniref:ImmA/IrrE family metallo-endopeptidase n=1 Tax=Leucobacter japonicus TaxID=1461259 RepID=UPI0006A7BE56|nr:ImmA/IrrE family metallo-endopeptidase [Leucobacter japonicus]